MKKKIREIYLSLAVIIAALLTVMGVQHLCDRKVQKQSLVESNLPSGNYLPDAEDPLVRVVIRTNGFREIAHPNVELSADHGMILRAGEEQQEIGAGEVLRIAPDDGRFAGGTIRMQTKEESDRLRIHTLKRGYGIPDYGGSLELYATGEGIVIVNEIPLEDYLCAVVPSEMPASYEPEALKCQAVCARSYAYCQMLAFGYPEYSAHVDDSVSYQVYGNSKEQETTTRAVLETAGQRLWYQGQVVKTYYYSTSSGYSTSVEAWGSAVTNDTQYLQGVSIRNEAGAFYEEQLPWYRWKAVIPGKTLSNLLEQNTGNKLGKLQNLTVTKKGAGGVVLQITATGTKGDITVDTENKIRSALGGSGYEITKQDGTVVKSTKLLPSAFFTITKSGDHYIIEGGGYGHGIGMSQNGANEMAKAGKNYEQILQFFYPGTEVR